MCKCKYRHTYMFMLPACSEPSACLLYAMELTNQHKNVSALARRIHTTPILLSYQ